DVPRRRTARDAAEPPLALEIRDERSVDGQWAGVRVEEERSLREEQLALRHHSHEERDDAAEERDRSHGDVLEVPPHRPGPDPLGRRGDQPYEFGEPPLDHLEHQLLLATEVAVDAALGAPGPLGD